MKAIWSMQRGLTVIGQHHGQPRRWTVTAWAMLPGGIKERLTVRPPVKCTLRDIIPLMNRELERFELEHGQNSIDAGFQAVAR